MITFCFALETILYSTGLERKEWEVHASDDKSDLVITVNSNVCSSAIDAVKYFHGLCMEVMYGCAL